jgi:hypothetical protein
MHLGEEDEFISKAAQAEIKAALAKKPNATVYSYPGQRHAFSRHNGLHYAAAAAALANERISKSTIAMSEFRSQRREYRLWVKTSRQNMSATAAAFAESGHEQEESDETSAPSISTIVGAGPIHHCRRWSFLHQMLFRLAPDARLGLDGLKCKLPPRGKAHEGGGRSSMATRAPATARSKGLHCIV